MLLIKGRWTTNIFKKLLKIILVLFFHRKTKTLPFIVKMLHSDPSLASDPVSQRGLRQEEVFWFGRCHSSGILPRSIPETLGVGRKHLSAVPPASSSSLEGLESNHADRPQLFLFEVKWRTGNKWPKCWFSFNVKKGMLRILMSFLTGAEVYRF